MNPYVLFIMVTIPILFIAIVYYALVSENFAILPVLALLMFVAFRRWP